MNPKDIIKFAKIVGKLKRVRRAGWVRERVKDPESAADHSFRMAILAAVLAKELDLNAEKVIKMALIHDLAEAITGDMVIERGARIVGNAKKQKKEGEKAIRKIFFNLANSQEFIKLWLEIENGETVEAKFVKEIGKLETAMTASDYIEEGNDPQKLAEFFENAQVNIKNPKLLRILKSLKKE